MLLLLTLLIYVYSVSAAKLGIFLLDVSNSQLIFNKRVGEVMAEAGHDVTIIMMRPFKRKTEKVDIDPRVKVYVVETNTGLDFEELEKLQSDMIFEDFSWFDSRQKGMLKVMTEGMNKNCEQAINSKAYRDWLREQQFDLAYVHHIDYCTMGIIHLVQIPTWIWLDTAFLLDHMADALGVPIIPSYVSPMVMAAGSNMNFIERTKSFVGHGLMKILFPRFTLNPMNEIFRENVSPDFPDLEVLSRQCPLAMINSNELYEMTRPTLHKVINIGGIGMKYEDAKPLKKEFRDIVNSAVKGVIVMSFGSIARADSMPPHWKESFMTAFSSFPDYQFILRYPSHDIDNIKPKNVHFFSWLPQSDLLRNNKTVAFISHGGYNSVQESLNSGKPIITIPLFGDQPRNSRLVVESGFGIEITKSELNADTIERVIRQITKDERFVKKSQRILEMVRKKPIQPEQLLIKWTEFLVEFKTLDNLTPYGVHLSFITYHSIDVILFLLSIIVLFVFVLWKTVRAVILRCCCGQKQKRE